MARYLIAAALAILVASILADSDLDRLSAEGEEDLNEDFDDSDSTDLEDGDLNFQKGVDYEEGWVLDTAEEDSDEDEVYGARTMQGSVLMLSVDSNPDLEPGLVRNTFASLVTAEGVEYPLIFEYDLGFEDDHHEFRRIVPDMVETGDFASVRARQVTLHGSLAMRLGRRHALAIESSTEFQVEPSHHSEGTRILGHAFGEPLGHSEYSLSDSEQESRVAPNVAPTYPFMPKNRKVRFAVVIIDIKSGNWLQKLWDGTGKNEFRGQKGKKKVLKSIRKVEKLFKKSSWNQVEFEPFTEKDIFGPYKAEIKAGSCPDVMKLMSKMKELPKKEGIDLEDRTTRIFVIPYSHGCKWSGLGTLRNFGGPSSTLVVDTSADLFVMMHEFGHNMGFRHATFNGDEYGDDGSIMGRGKTTYNGPHRYLAGWLNPAHIHNFDSGLLHTGEQKFNLAALDLAPGSRKGAKSLIRMILGGQNLIYMEYRRCGDQKEPGMVNYYCGRVHIRSMRLPYVRKSFHSKCNLEGKVKPGDKLKMTRAPITVKVSKEKNGVVEVAIKLNK